MSDWSRDCEDLFHAGRQVVDEPSEEDRRRIAQRIAAQLAGGSATSTATRELRAGGTSRVGLSLSAKVVASLALGVGAAIVAAVAVSRPPAPASSPLATRAPTSYADSVVSSEPIEVTEPASPPLSASPPERHEPARVAAPRRASSPDPAKRPHDTDGELRLVRGIDDALRRGDYRGAMRALDEHDAAFGPGHFAEECAAARVLALCGEGLTESGRRSACAFFSRYPRSPMNERIRGACSARCE
jgi:hypothetical protein